MTRTPHCWRSARIVWLLGVAVFALLSCHDQSVPKGTIGRYERVPASSKGVFELQLRGNQSFWTEYRNIALRAGDKVRFEATGKITRPGRAAELGPAGIDSTPASTEEPDVYQLSDSPIAGLIGNIGSSVFTIGERLDYTVTDPGPLRLTVNERWRHGAWDGNRGNFQVRVTIEPE